MEGDVVGGAPQGHLVVGEGGDGGDGGDGDGYGGGGDGDEVTDLPDGPGRVVGEVGRQHADTQLRLPGVKG